MVGSIPHSVIGRDCCWYTKSLLISLHTVLKSYYYEGKLRVEEVYLEQTAACGLHTVDATNPA